MENVNARRRLKSGSCRVAIIFEPFLSCPLIPLKSKTVLRNSATTLFAFDPLQLFVLGVFCFLPAVGQCQEATTSPPNTESESIELFNGEDLSGWDGDPRFWRVEDGELIGETTAKVAAESNTFLIYRESEFSDFDLSFEYQVTGYNSGVQYRSREIGKWSVAGYQCDFEAEHHLIDGKGTDRFSGMFFDEQGRMFLGQRGQVVLVRPNTKDTNKPIIDQLGTIGDSAQLESIIRRDNWNEMRVIANGFTFTHIINGQVMCVGFDEDTENRKDAGILAFQLHSGPPMKIRIRNLSIRELR